MTGKLKWALGLWVLSSCAPPPGEPAMEARWSSIPNAYARCFELQVRGAERRLVVFGPAGRTDTVGKYQFRGLADGQAELLPVPDRTVVLSTTHLAYFSALDAVDRVVGTAHTDQIRDPRSIEAVRNGAVKEVARADGVDREMMMALDPHVIFDYPFGSEQRKAITNVPVVNVTEYLELHPLGRAEWLRFFGMLLGKEERADSLFAAITHRYEFLRDTKTHLPGSPTVLFASHWEGAWFVPPGNSYMSTLISDAGGRYVYADSMANGNIALPLERLLVQGDTIDHLGVLLAYRGMVDASVLAGGDPRVRALKALRDGAFFGNSATSDLFGQALLEPDVVLRDLRCIFHPGTFTGKTGAYFKALP